MISLICNLTTEEETTHCDDSNANDSNVYETYKSLKGAEKTAFYNEHKQEILNLAK